MAQNIGPRIGIEGEAEYRRQMQNIIQQTKTYQAAVKEAQSALDRNASSQQKAQAKTQALTKAIEAQRKQVEYCQNMLNASKEKYGENATQTLKWEEALHKANTQLNELNQQLADSNRLKAWGEDVVKAGERLEQAGRKISSAGETLTRTVTVPIVTAGAAAVKSSIDFETAMTGVMKTVDETATTSYADIAEAIKKMSTETASSKTEIAAVAEAAGQLGVGADDIEKFTKVMIMLGDTTNVNAQDAATSLAKFVNITGDSLDDVDRLGSSIVDLGNNFATDEASIIAMATRLASAGTIAGLSSTDILALAASMSSVGIEAEAGGTAMSQTLTNIGNRVANFKDGTEEALDDISKVTGMSAQEFADAWEKDPIKAVQSFIEGLDRMNSSGENVNAILDDLGMKGIRQSNMLKSLALASGNMSDAIDTSSEAYKENTALVNEANKRYQTTASRLNQVKEKASNAAITFGNSMLPMVDKAIDKAGAFADKLAAMDEAERGAVIRTAAFAAATGPVLVGVGKTVTAVGQITQGVGKAAIKIGEIQTAMQAAGGAGQFLAAGFGGTAIAAGAVLLPLAALAKVFWDAGASFREATEEQAAFAEKTQAAADAANAAAAQVDGVGAAIEQSAAGFEGAGTNLDYFRNMLNSCYDETGHLKAGMEATAEYALNELNNAMGTDYSTEFIAQAENSKQALEEINGAIDQNIEKLKAQAIAQAFQRDYPDALKAQADAHTALTTAEDTYTEAVKNAKTAQDELIAAMQKNVIGEYSEEVQTAKKAQLKANAAVEQAAEAYETAAEAAGKADAQVDGLSKAMEEASKGTPEGIQKAADAYANIGTEAGKAGDEASKAADKIITSNAEATDKAIQAAQDAFKNKALHGHVESVDGGPEAAEKAKSEMEPVVSTPMDGNIRQVLGGASAALLARNGMEGVIKPPMQGNVNKVNGGNAAANSAKSGMNTIIKKPMQGNVNQVTGGVSAASAAKASMNPIIASPMTGKVGSVTNAVSAASTAHSEAQSYFSNHPFKAVVNIVQNVTRTVSEIVSKVAHNARGGFVNEEQLSWLAEGNKPEVVIPLDVSERTRAIDLFRRTAAILGAGDVAYLPSLAEAGAGSSVNYGGINVVINAAEGQSEESIADAVINRIQNELTRREAMHG